ncbi:MAG: phosphate ABC transporter substrate-binding protein PstS [Spirochaetia bacterium]|jgi:phosphate transport system substrate-binding protein
MNIKRLALAAMILALAAGLGFSQELTGAGATFPAPFYTKVFDQYAKEFGVKVNYQAIGSGGGIAQIKSKTVDFGASDAFLKDADLAAMPAAVLHIPMVAGAVVLTYNLPGNPELKFTPDVLADIFLGKIKTWNDPRIAAINAGVNLLKSTITVVHRSDGSGTTNVFTDYLSKVSDEWKTKVGSNTSVSWPVGIGGKGNAGVAGLVKQLPGSFGYVELIYALQNDMPYGLLKNKAGAFIKPSLASTSAACAVDMPDDTRVSVTDTSSPDGYSIAGFTWILLYKEQNYANRPQEKADAVVKMLWWMTHEAQKYAEPLAYAQLPGPVVKKAEVILRSVTFNGTPLMK